MERLEAIHLPTMEKNKGKFNNLQFSYHDKTRMNCSLQDAKRGHRKNLVGKDIKKHVYISII